MRINARSVIKICEELNLNNKNSKSCGILPLYEDNLFVYHHTSYPAALNICLIDKLLVGKTGFISFTTNKNLHLQGTVGFSGHGVYFQVFRKKLENDYKLESYKYHSLDIKVNDESEVRIETNKINKFLSYVKSINLIKTYYPSPTDVDSRLLYRFMKIEEPTFDEYIKFLQKCITKPINIV